MQQEYKTARQATGMLQASDQLKEHRMPNDVVDLQDKLSRFSNHWSPRTVAEYNGHDVMVVKVQGTFQWHSHADTDDFFLVLTGRLSIDLPGRTVHLGPGQLFVVPRGVQHRPHADEETHLLLIEPTGTSNSGDARKAAPRLLL